MALDLPALLLPIVLLFWGLGDFGLLNNVEGMYAEIGREMLADGTWQGWIIPHLNGLPYIEKPPLLYWSIAVSLSVFGVHDWAVRLVPALAGVLCLGAVYAYGRASVGPRYGFLAAFVLGTSAGFVMMSKVAMTDPVLSAFLTAALLGSRLALQRQQPALLRWAMACLALAVLSKGLVALALYGLVWCGWLLTAGRRNWRNDGVFLASPGAWGVFLLVAAPWHIAAALALPEFSWFYFINEHVLRFLGLREPRDYYAGTPLYYLPRVALMAAPWCLALLSYLSGSLRQRLGNATIETGFLWACVLVPLAFFSASSAKANYYILVCLPGLALLAAGPLEAWIVSNGPRRLLAVLVAGIAFIPAVGWMLHYAAVKETKFSARQMAYQLQQRKDGLPLFLYQDFEDYSALPFYLQSNGIGIVDQRSADLCFGLGLAVRDAARYPSAEDFAVRREPALLLILDARVRDGLPPLLAPRLEKLERVGNATLYRFNPR